MERFIIHGGKRLSGEVEISGSKNASLPCIIATLLTDESCTIYNVPQLEDVKAVCSLLKVLGKKIEFKKNTVFVKPGDDLHPFAPYELVSKMRASMLVMGPLLIRTKKAKVSLPGGCAIGSRPINLHLQSLTQLGADISLEEGYVILTANKLSGTKIVFDFPSVGATENLLMVASLAEGKTVIENAACEPEIVDLASFLNQMGAKIKGAGTRTVEIIGVSRLQGSEHTVIPDRIESGTFLLAGLITGGKITLRKVIPEHLELIMTKLAEAGAKIKSSDQSISISSDKELKPVDIETLPYPGFPTDMQAQWMTLMSVTKGKSVIRETIFENRFLHVGELQRMGAKIEVKGNTAVVEGVKHLSGAPVKATDLRASAALLLAGLVAEGKTEIDKIYHLERGYENIILKLRNLGAKIRRMKN